MQTIYGAVSCVGIAALVMLVHIVGRSDLLSRPSKRYFKHAVWAVVLVMVAEAVTVLCESGAPALRVLHVLGNAVGFALSPMVPLLIGCAIGGPNRRMLTVLALPSAVNTVLALLSPWFPLIFWVDAANGYSRGGCFWVFVLAYAGGLIYLLVQTFDLTRRYQNSNRALPVVLFVFVCVGTTCQVALPWLHLSWLCASFALMLYYMYCCDLLQQIDGLTGLLNRRTYDYHMQTVACGADTAAVIFDIDDFKLVNDRYGHPFGDQCITSVAACIRKSFFKLGLCFRIGGDEFCVIARETDLPAVERAYKRFLREIEAMRAQEPRIPLVSIGYAFTQGRDLPAAVEEADQNMYKFKRRRNKLPDA